MNNDKRSGHVTRETVLSLLTPDEVTKVSNAEMTELKRGDEYIDLSYVTLGVRTVEGKPRSAKDALRRSSVGAETWAKIIALLASP